MARTENRTRSTNDLRVQRLLKDAERVAGLTADYLREARTPDEARRAFPFIAEIYVDCFMKYGPDDQLTKDAHRAMCWQRFREQQGPSLPGADATDMPEAIRVMFALENGAATVRTACAIARAAAVITKNRAQAKKILSARPDAADGGFRDRIRKERVFERWLDAKKLHLVTTNGFVARGEWRSDNDEVESYRRTLREVIARHDPAWNLDALEDAMPDARRA